MAPPSAYWKTIWIYVPLLLILFGLIPWLLSILMAWIGLNGIQPRLPKGETHADRA
jgi:hypothetical protein